MQAWLLVLSIDIMVDHLIAKKFGCVVSLCAAAAFAPVSALAQMHLQDTVAEADNNRLPDANNVYPFAANDITLDETLRLFSRNLRIGLSIEEEFDGTAKVDVELEMTREDYLEELAAMFDFNWYFDGAILHIFSAGTIETHVFSLQQTNGHELISLLVSLGVYQPRFRHRADDRRRALLVSGPKPYLEVVAKVVEAAETSEQRKVTVMRGGTSLSTSVAASTAELTDGGPAPSLIPTE